MTDGFVPSVRPFHGDEFARQPARRRSPRIVGPFDGRRMGAMTRAIRIYELNVGGCLIECYDAIAVGRRIELADRLDGRGLDLGGGGDALPAPALRLRGEVREPERGQSGAHRAHDRAPGRRAGGLDVRRSRLTDAERPLLKAATYAPPKNDGSRMSRIVRSPGAAVSTAGIELTVIDAVAMSPCTPPAIFE